MALPSHNGEGQYRTDQHVYRRVAVGMQFVSDHSLLHSAWPAFFVVNASTQLTIKWANTGQICKQVESGRWNAVYEWRLPPTLVTCSLRGWYDGSAISQWKGSIPNISAHISRVTVGMQFVNDHLLLYSASPASFVADLMALPSHNKVSSNRDNMTFKLLYSTARGLDPPTSYHHDIPETQVSRLGKKRRWETVVLTEEVLYLSEVPNWWTKNYANTNMEMKTNIHHLEIRLIS